MAKRKGKSRSIAVRRSRRGRSGKASPRGIIPVSAGLGVTGILIANDFGGTGGAPLGYLQSGNFGMAFQSLSKNLTSPAVITALVPAVIILWALLALHRKFGSRTRVSRKWSVV